MEDCKKFTDYFMKFMEYGLCITSGDNYSSGDLTSIKLLHPDVLFIGNVLVFNCSDDIGCIIYLYSNGLKKLELVDLDGTSQTFVPINKILNISNIIRLLKDKYPLIDSKFTPNEYIEYRKKCLSELLNLLQPENKN